MKTALTFLLMTAAAWAGDNRDDVARKLETKVSVDLRAPGLRTRSRSSGSRRDSTS